MSRNNHLKGRIQRARLDRAWGKRGAHIAFARNVNLHQPVSIIVGQKGTHRHRLVQLEA